MSWISLLTAALQLVSWIAKQADKRDIEEALINEIEILQGKRIRDAIAARDNVISGRVPVDTLDPNRRD